MYEVFSVLSGIVLLIGGITLPGSGLRRLGWLAGGSAFIAYGIYVAQAESGYFVFPVAIFLIPVFGALMIGKGLISPRDPSRGLGAAPVVESSARGRPAPNVSLTPPPPPPPPPPPASPGHRPGG